MKRRTRIAGLFALVAMTFALTETVWASTCAPTMDMQASDATVADEVPSHDCMFAVIHEREGDDEDERRCPLSPAAPQTCAAAASLPSHAMDLVAPSPDDATDVFFELTQHGLLLKDTLFHPPRA